MKCPAKGPLFQVEITLVRPIEFPDGVLRPNITYSQVNFKPGQIRRHYIMVPEKVAYGGNFFLLLILINFTQI